MKTKNTNIFRFKSTKPRKTCIQLDSQNQSDKDEDKDEETSIRKGFSSEYLNLAKKFNIKLVTDHSLSRVKKDEKLLTSLNIKIPSLRIKTDFSKPKTRYRWDSPSNCQQMKPHSVWVSEKNGDRSNRNNREAMLKLNRNTIYNDAFFRLRNGSEQDKLLYVQEQMVKLTLKEGDGVLVNLGNHCRKLLSVKQAMERKSMGEKQIIREIKMYVMREEGYSISKLDRCFGEELRKQVKELIIVERMVLVSIVCNLIGHHLGEMLEESNRAIEIILGYWYQIINNTYSDNIYKLQIQQDSEIKQIMDALSEAKLLTKSNIRLLLETLHHKLPLLFKYYKQFFSKLTFLLTLCKDISINRAFYDLLTLFAGFLIDLQNKNHVNLDSVSFFATCPSPYFVKASTKKYSLVVDLDETLLYCAIGKGADKKGQIAYRPGAFAFIEQLSSLYQIIIFTTSLQTYARQVTKDFKGIDNYLFRQHAVRSKYGFTKDLSRLGRNLNKLIILDDMSSNFKWQKENGIKIKSWQGDPNDNELEVVKSVLMKIVKKNSEDIKTDLNSFREELTKKSSVLQSPDAKFKGDSLVSQMPDIKSTPNVHGPEEIKNGSIIPLSLQVKKEGQVLTDQKNNSIAAFLPEDKSGALLPAQAEEKKQAG